MSPDAEPLAEEWLVVVELTRPHGLRGEMSGRADAIEPSGLFGLPLRLRRRGGETSPVRLLGARPAGRAWIIALDGVGDRNEADTLRGAVLLARRSDLPELDSGEWYVADLVGLRVVDETGEDLGLLEEVLKLPANDVFVVRGERGEVLVPVLDHVILGVDRSAGSVHVRLPPGLLDPPGAGEAER